MIKIDVILDWFPNTNHTGFLIALKKGYFKDKGLDVQISGEVHGVIDPSVADIVVAPQISFLDKISSGEELTVIATLTQKNDSGIISLKESGITSPKMLEGKRLTHWDMEWFHEVIGKAVEMDGGDYDKVDLIPMDVGDIQSTLENITDATWVYENWENQELLEAGKEINYFNLADIDPLFDFPAPCIGAKHRLLEDHPQAVRDFLECLNRGYKEASQDPKESILFVKEYIPDVSEALLIRSQKHLADILLDETGHWGTIRPERWNTMADWMLEKGLYDKRRSTEFTNEFLPASVKNE